MPDTAAGVQNYWAYQLELMETLPAQVHERQPESIHGLRAAGRRLKATVRIYRPLIRRRLAHDLFEALDWYNSVLGLARDAEVIAEELTELLGDRSGAGVIISSLEAERERTARIADDMLTSTRVDDVLELVDELVKNPWRSPGGQPVSGEEILSRGRWAERRVATQWCHGPRQGEATEQWLHQLRRRAKAARFAAESVQAVIPGAKAVAQAYDRLATLLGAVQDTAVIKRALAPWPDVLVADAIAAREELAKQGLRDLPKMVEEAVPEDLLAGRQKAPLTALANLDETLDWLGVTES